MSEVHLLKDSDIKLNHNTAEVTIDGVTKHIRDWKTSYTILTKLYKSGDMPEDVVRLGQLLKGLELMLGSSNSTNKESKK